MIWVMLGWVTIGLTVTIRVMGDMGDDPYDQLGVI